MREALSNFIGLCACICGAMIGTTCTAAQRFTQMAGKVSSGVATLSRRHLKEFFLIGSMDTLDALAEAPTVADGRQNPLVFVHQAGAADAGDDLERGL